MPTPVSTARQCLAGEASDALDAAVAVARRRAHSQTTSLHVVSALLSLPSPSLLRDALSCARSAAYSPRLQLKALELCFSAALDRLPSASAAAGGGGDDNQQPPAEPPVSNSFMAALKRSQANQRRNPDTFHLYQQHHYQQQQQNSSSFAGVKVELRQLVLSILDDPIVSRVFADAGFRSSDVKFAVLRPPPSVLRLPRAAARRPPLFLCNFSTAGDEFDGLTPRGFTFPFSDAADGNCRRIAEVLARNTCRNPLLVGVGAGDAAADFERAVGGQKWAAFPPGLRGLKFFSIEKEVSDFIRVGQDPMWLGARFAELAQWLAAEESPGVVVSIGDLKAWVDAGWEDGGGGEGLGGGSIVVAELTRLVDANAGRLWLMGTVATYETYTRFLLQYPSVDKDWDLQLLPITSLKPETGRMCHWPSSLMESFVPFGGFFPVASNAVAPSSRQYQSEDPCHLCSDKYDQELAALLKEFSVPVEEKCHMDFPELRQIDPTSICGLPDAEAKDDGTILNSKVMNLKKKWKDICQHLHQGRQMLETDIFQVGSEAFPHAIGLPYVAGKESSNSQINRNTDGSLEESFQGNVFPLSVSLQKMSSVNKSISMPIISKSKSEDFSLRLQPRPSKSEQLQANGFQSHSGSLSDLGATDEHASSSSVISVSTDLMLGAIHPSLNEEKSEVHPRTVEYSPSLAYSKSPMLRMCWPVQTASGPKVTGPGASAANKRNSCLANICEPFDIQDFKTLFSSLAGKVGWQEEAIHAISKTVVHCRTGNEKLRGISLRGDIWLSFLGPDRVGKRKIAMALAELLFGSRDKLISVDLSLQDGFMPSNTICNYQDARYDLNLRGKTIVDHIAKELSEKPCSVVLLENVDKADLLLQSSLSHAIRTGKFSDSYKREVGISNAVFVVTAGVKEEAIFSNKGNSMFSEEQILTTQAWQMMILVDRASDSVGRIPSLDASGISMRESMSKFVFVSKRKLNMADDRKGQLGSMRRAAKQVKGTSSTFFDLNLPVEEMVADDTANGSGESCSISDIAETWMEEFLDTVDENVFFKPFDFDTLADDISKEITKSFRNSVCSKCVLEIDPRAMEQILAATWFSEGKAALDNWLQQVLARGFVEARQHLDLSSQSVLRLVACEDVLMGDHAPGILLPSHILLG